MTSDAPSFARDTLSRPKVDLSGVIQGMGAVADEAGRVVEMSNQLAAPYGAIADLGQTIAQAGGAVGALMVKSKEAKAKNQTFDAELEIANTLNAVNEYQTLNPTDPDSWEPNRQKALADLERRIANNPKLLPEVRDALIQKVKMTDVETKGRTFTDSAKAQFQMARSSTIAEMERAAEVGDPEQWRRSADEGIAKGWLYPHERENAWQGFQRTQKRKGLEAEAEAEKSYVTSTLAVAAVNPKDWLARNPTAPEGVDPILHVKTRNQVEAMARDGDAYIASTVGSMIMAGQITVPAEIDAMAESTPGFTPDLVAHFKDTLLKYDQRKMEIYKAKHGDESFVRHWLAAEKVDFDQYPDDASKAKAFSDMLIRAKLEVPEDRVGEVTSLLHEKYGARNTEEPKTRPESQRLASKSLANAYTRGLFGELERFDKTANKGKGGMVPDPMLEQQAMTRMAQAEAAMSSFFRAHPDATPTEVEVKLGEVTKAHKTTKAAGTILLAPPKARAAKANGPVDWTRHLKGAPPPASGGSQSFDTPNGAPFSPDDETLPPGPPPPTVRQPSTGAVKQFRDAPDLPEKLPAPLQPHAQDYIDAGKEYGVDPKFLAAISMLETADGTSSAFRRKNNAMGISDSKGPTKQASVRDSIFHMAKRLAAKDGYYAGANTIDEIGAIYAPPGAGNDPKKTNSYWPKGVKEKLKRLES